VLFGFFVVPAVIFAAWSYRRLRSDDAEERALLVWQTLRGVASGGLDDLSTDAALVGTPILLYDDGVLRSSSDSLYDDLAPLGRFLRPDLELGLDLGNEVRASRSEALGGGRVLIGYRAVDAPGGDRVVLAAPARGDEAGLDTRRDDLGILVLFTTVLGAAAALGLSGLAARRFARPIDALRRAALAMAVGDREPDLAGDPPVEFAPVFAAFRRMAADFGESQRVLAWGEMARQVAHEIKNPLTPIRLGIQHLQRARAARRPDFDRILDQNAGRILSEIDRLDQIARAFSRYGSAPDERAPAEPTDIVHVVQDVVELERLGAGGGVVWDLAGADDDVVALARADDLREVLLNVLENARLAHAKRVSVHIAVERGGSDRPHAPVARDGTGRAVITVADDGEGIGPEVLPRIFEPHFSTRTSGSGLGLALSRRIVDGWGGTISVQSEPGTGTRVTIVLPLSVA
jgi:signal transduction histidine kinase